MYCKTQCSPNRQTYTLNKMKLIVLSVLASMALAMPATVPAPSKNYVPNEYERQQNNAARYQFSSDIDDHISDLTHQRTEEREGLAVKGMYSYSDGYYKRTVEYVADEKGYRVIGMTAVPLDGPHIDLSGTASVAAAAHGAHFAYKVQSVPVDGPVAKVTEFE